MVRKTVAAVLFLSLVPFGIFAAETDNAASSPDEDESTPSEVKTSFQGVWVGTWPGFGETKKGQDFKIKIGKEVKDRTYVVVNSWETTELKRGIVPSGKARTESTEQEEKFLFQFEIKQGRKFTVTLQKRVDETLEARIEKSGPIGQKERPYNDTYVKRK